MRSFFRGSQARLALMSTSDYLGALSAPQLVPAEEPSTRQFRTRALQKKQPRKTLLSFAAGTADFGHRAQTNAAGASQLCN